MANKKFTDKLSFDKITATNKYNVDLDVDTNGRLIVSSNTNDGGLKVSGVNSIATFEGPVEIPSPTGNTSPVNLQHFNRSVAGVSIIPVSNTDYVMTEDDYFQKAVVFLGATQDINIIYPDDVAIPFQNVLNFTDYKLGIKTVSNSVSATLEKFEVKIIANSGGDITVISLTHREINREKTFNFTSDANVTFTAGEMAYQQLNFTDDTLVLTDVRDITIDSDAFGNSFLPLQILWNETDYDIRYGLTGGSLVTVPSYSNRVVFRDILYNDVYELPITLDSLSDVVITTPQNRQVLAYSTQSNGWVNIGNVLGNTFRVGGAVETTDDTPTTILSYTTTEASQVADIFGNGSNSDGVIQFKIMCTGISNAGLSISVNVRGAMKGDSGGSAALIGSLTTETYDASAAAYSVTVTASGTETLDVTVVGDAGDDTNWVCDMEFMYVTFTGGS